MATLVIDGKKCAFTKTQTILEAARENGFHIPTLCYHKKTGPAGRCGLCVVKIEGMQGLQTACTAEAEDGMSVKTETPEILEARKTIVNLLLAAGEHNCLSCEANGECELQNAAYELGIERPAFFAQNTPIPVDDSSAMIVRDAKKCIKCGRCVVACNCNVVNEVLYYGYRGCEMKVICDHDKPLVDSSCVQCGECVQLCPVGAAIDKKSIGRGRPWELEKVNTTCAYCGVGCQVTLHVDRSKNSIVKVTGRDTLPNEGMLCVKGRYGFEFPSSENRLKYPLIKKNGKHERVSWDEALDYTAAKIKSIIDRDGPDVFSAFGSGRITNENNYALMKFTRAVIKTNNIDHCART